MDRRQKRTREAIFNAFCELLSKKNYNAITVGEIIERADVGRATFYAHFETKDYLLRELCAELFCHIFDSAKGGNTSHRHIFECEAPSSVFLHLLRHLRNNDNNILNLLSSQNNELFLKYFKENLISLVKDQIEVFENKRKKELPEDLFINHVSSTFVETVRWWVEKGMIESPEKIAEYFLKLI